MPLGAARIAGVSAYLPETWATSRDVEAQVERSGPYRPRPGVIEKVTGIRRRCWAPEDWQASDLAVAAAQKLLAEAGLAAIDIDLLLFASASQDMAEPATAHITAAKLGAQCPVFDVKNACNSMLNALQVADALIRTGQHRRVLICTGEVPSRAIRWRVKDRAQFVQAFPGYTLADSGAAILLEAASPAQAGGIFHRAFSAESSAWDVGTLPGGGTAHPRDPEYSYYRMDGRQLMEAFQGLGPGLLHEALAATGLAWTDFAAICVHQVSMPYLRRFCAVAEVPIDRVVVTLPEHGNLASATLPFQLATAIERGDCGPGDRVALIGMAGGVSLGVVFATL